MLGSRKGESVGWDVWHELTGQEKNRGFAQPLLALLWVPVIQMGPRQSWILPAGPPGLVGEGQSTRQCQSQLLPEDAGGGGGLGF